VITTLPLALVLSAVFAGSGALALVCAPDRARPLARLTQPAMAASMLAMTWTRAGALALSWQAILIAGLLTLDHRPATTVPAAASIWMLVARPGPVAGAVLGATLLAAAGVQARTAPAEAGCHALMGLGMAAMLLAQNA
jgi:hypothetical protein